MEKILEKKYTDRPQNISEERNQGLSFNTKYFEGININRSAIERRVATLTARRSVKKEFQAAWLLKAISMIDLTTLAGDDTRGNVLRLCEKAKHPVREDLLVKLGMQDENLTTGAVCVYHNLIPFAKEALQGTNIPIAAVSTGFPAGKISLEEKLTEIKKSVAAGATEIDIVISRDLVLESRWKELYEEIKLCRQACGEAHMKTILATGEIPTYTKVAKASWVAMMAGSDFIKTSTGKESVNATLEVSLVMIRCIRDYYELTGVKVGYKPAGGIQKAKQALDYLILIKEELGNDWLNPHLFRFGASSLLGDIERQLEHYVTGRYSAGFRHPMA
ncbi:deoxyribose-phosphate aldolase [Chryseobacterium koreense]|uniref:Deoxyribose-phosphate aldolase n=1 Tax=Chryseobacterium koreense CCUG 49689 TaxID=1304281 RepID=A0A0J7IY76_9FLAO|nr:deoxyribose-phosphate aldolase [Chryseobacterium koreense]KMQ71198.1 deoxyribose-phosphate aldolase [Chryseobacterium koreense CCUG 49689]MBB5332672.1 deoxyribose-phosphate aldolase [Chryseobacterium koreense]